ncbi:MarR family winged helix-turn-helix transcriptional regulator [Brevibacillus migulae]|uniref:MarR family winged helix-turn-helix transcriptional regulator n=1 Tax=Brevibacillus migulae TaxID=1644114 RepID=UPI00142F8425|nr:MarR family transcriptional regulator [Brevibacillus migulae]
MEDLQRYAIRIRKAMNKTRREINNVLQTQTHFELKQPQLHLLTYISEHEPCKITDLAKKFEVNPSTISTMINKFVQDGFVIREYSKDDRRNVFVTVTDQGKHVLSRELENYNKVVGQYLSRLNKTELETLLNILEKMAES